MKPLREMTSEEFKEFCQIIVKDLNEHLSTQWAGIAHNIEVKNETERQV
jgi:hypothetical protein